MTNCRSAFYRLDLKEIITGNFYNLNLGGKLMPLHPMVVHFPIVLSVLIPLAMIAVIAASKKITNQRAAWAVIFGFCVLLTVSSVISMKLGEREEEKVEKVVSEQIVENHAEWAEDFVWATFLPLLFTGLMLKKKHPSLKYLAAASGVAVLALGVITGHEGAELVYQHNAGKVYLSAAASSGGGSALAGEKVKDDDDD